MAARYNKSIFVPPINPLTEGFRKSSITEVTQHFLSFIWLSCQPRKAQRQVVTTRRGTVAGFVLKLKVQQSFKTLPIVNRKIITKNCQHGLRRRPT